jgi:hypothetical protein
MNKIYRVYTCKTDSVKSVYINGVDEMIFHKDLAHLDMDSLNKHGWSFYGSSDWSGIKNGWVIWEEDKFGIEDIYTMLVVYPRNRLSTPDKEFILNFKRVIRCEKIKSLDI